MSRFLTRTRFLLGRIALVFIAIAVALPAGELALRLFGNPVDYLEPQLVKDDILGHRIVPCSAYHDAWGFRNRMVPAQSDIVAIGDSQTYGTSATASRSWPAQLAQITGRNVYNMSVGGYGPMEYEYLLTDKALALKPSFVVVGLYMGNDLGDAYGAVYGREHWKNLRRGLEPGTASSAGTQTPSQTEAWVASKRFGDLRKWLSRHSTLYRLLTLTCGSSMRMFEMKHFRPTIQGGVLVTDSGGNVLTGLTPYMRHQALDISSRRINEGIRLSVDALARMHQTCRDSGIAFLVAVIPTKESVYAGLGRIADSKDREMIDRVVADEHSAIDQITRQLTALGVPNVDLLPCFRAAATNTPLYPCNFDGHPNANGYRILADVVSGYVPARNERGEK